MFKRDCFVTAEFGRKIEPTIFRTFFINPRKRPSLCWADETQMCMTGL